MHSPWAARARAVFALDLRSLALFRVLLAASVLADGFAHACLLRDFDADDGVLPRALLTQLGDPARLSLHMISGAVAVQALLWLLQMLAAAALFAGWRTRAAAIVTFLLSVSLAARNPWGETAGEALQAVFLFFSLLVPLGARWSVDAALSGTPAPVANALATTGGAALLLQVALVPLVAALAQGGAAWRTTHTALQDALALPTFAHAPGDWLIAVPAVLPVLTAVLWWSQVAIPLGILFPAGQPVPRRFALALYALVNAALLLSFSSGTLPLVGLAGAAVLIDEALWDRLARRVLRGQPDGRLRIYHDRASPAARRRALLLREFLVLPATDVLPAQDSARIDRLLQSHPGAIVLDRDDAAHLGWNATVLLLRRSALFWPLAGLAAVGPGASIGARLAARAATRRGRSVAARHVDFDAPRPLRRAGLASSAVVALAQILSAGDPARLPAAVRAPLAALGLDRGVSLLAPAPPRADRWMVIGGERADGTEVDVLHGHSGPPDFARPAHPPAYRWRIYAGRVADDERPALRDAWAERLCRAWDGPGRVQGERLKQVRLVLMVQQGPTAQPEQNVLIRHECGTGIAGAAAATGG